MRLTFRERLKLAFELLRARNLLLSTDRMSMIYVPVVINNKDRVVLAAQRASLEDFNEHFTVLRRDFDEALSKLEEDG